MNKENEEQQKPEEKPQETPEQTPEPTQEVEQKDTPESSASTDDKSDKTEKTEEKTSSQTDQPKEEPQNEKDSQSKDNKQKTDSSQNQTDTTPPPPEFMEKVISINRITKVTKGGKKLSFSALVVVGDTKGKVGYSLSKAAEVAIAIRKAMAAAKKDMHSISLTGSTIPHEIIGRCGGARVLLKPASDGTGVIASGPVRAICDGAGIHNILTKCHRSNNPINVIKATMDGLLRLKRKVVKEEVLENANASN